MSKIHKCQVCEGRGVMTIGFYTARGTFGNSATDTGDFSQTPCRSCNGRGIVIEGVDDGGKSAEFSREDHEIKEDA